MSILLYRLEEAVINLLRKKALGEIEKMRALALKKVKSSFALELNTEIYKILERTINSAKDKDIEELFKVQDSKNRDCRDTKIGRIVRTSIHSSTIIQRLLGSRIAEICFEYQTIYKGPSRYFNLCCLPTFALHIEDNIADFIYDPDILSDVVIFPLWDLYYENPWTKAMIQGVYDFCKKKFLNMLCIIDDEEDKKIAIWDKITPDKIGELRDMGFPLKLLMSLVVNNKDLIK